VFCQLLLINEIPFDLDVWYAGSSGHSRGQFENDSFTAMDAC